MEPWAAPLLLLLFAFCRGRVVRVPSGPLLRVEGTEVVIPCEVSDYEGPSEQNFDWQFALSGTLEGIVSTWDSSFTDPEYRERVRSKAIELRRVSNSVVTLHIQGIQGSDEGEYKCSTPSTDATVLGNYEASVYVRVIADALKLSHSKARSASSSPNITEGGDFQLQCLASTASAEHTHLAVIWEVQRDSVPAGAWQEVLSLGYDGTLQPGPGYEERSREGGVRLHKAPGDSYRLLISNALPEDGGTYRCVVQEWVQGVDESWQQMQQKELEIATVEVSPIVLSVSLNESDVALSRGDPLQLTCVVAPAFDGMARTEVAWYRSLTPEDSLADSQLLASMNHQSVVTETARVHLSQVETGSYRLTVAPTEEADGGFYYCRVGIWVPEGNGSWYKATEETSPAAAVLLSVAAPNFQVTLEATTSPSFSEEPTELVCRVSSTKLPSGMRFSVSWFYTPGQRSDDIAAPQLISTVDQNSVLQVEDKYQRRAQSGDIVFFKPDASSFTMRIRWTVDADRGSYKCIVAALSSDGADRWTKSKVEESRPVNIFWPSEDYLLSVQAIEERPLSAPGGTFQMTCKVSAQNMKVPHFSVVVTLERPPSGSSRVVSLSQDSVVRLADWKDLGRKDSVVLERLEENLFRFRLHHTQLSDAGLYRCLVTAWTLGGVGEWQQAINATSNAIKVDFQTSNGGPVFNVSVHSDSPAVYHGERVELLCIITIQGPALDPDDMSFDVSWFAMRSSALDTAPIFLASLDRHAVVTQAPRNGSSDVGIERVSAMEFRLRLHGCEEQDFGNHYCSVTPWVRSSANSWQQQPQVNSKTILVTIKADILSAFRYPLLIGAAFATAVGLLSCLIGYCSTRLCCKKLPVQEVRRDQRRRLMSMEMD